MQRGRQPKKEPINPINELKTSDTMVAHENPMATLLSAFI